MKPDDMTTDEFHEAMREMNCWDTSNHFMICNKCKAIGFTSEEWDDLRDWMLRAETDPLFKDVIYALLVIKIKEKEY